MILLDTNIVIRFFNGDREVLERILAEIDRIALPSLVVAELDYGAKVSTKARKNLEKLYAFVNVVQVAPFDLECAKVYGSIKSELRKIGKPTGEVDALISAIAMANQAVLVTDNKKHFENVPGLKIKVWSTE